MKPSLTAPLVCLLAVAATAAPTEALAQESLDATLDRALELPPPKPRYAESLKFGVRGVTFQCLALAPSDPKTFYVGSYDGFAFASHDGGLSWEEGRLITGRARFFGAIRPSPAPSGAPFGVGHVVDGIGSSTGAKHGYPSYDMGSLFSFPYGTTGASYLDLDPSGPAFWPMPALSGIPSGGRIKVRDAAGGGGGGGDMARLGVGITRAAPWMQALLHKKKARLIGLNLKLLLRMRGVEPTWINQIAVDPYDADRALAATGMGLYSSTDGGTGWQHVFPGRNAAERWCAFVAYHPTERGRVFMGTDQGLLISHDHGESFARPTGTQLSTAQTWWVEFHRTNPDIIYAATTIGAFRTDDGGRNWRWVFYETLPTANMVTGVAIDPKDPDRVTLSTVDGLFRTADGGRNWERSGGFLFTAQPVGRLRGDPLDGNHVVCSTAREVWETYDWGETWNIVYINDSDWQPRGIRFDPNDPSVFWILTSAELLRLSPRPPAQPSPQALSKIKALIAEERPLEEVMDLTFRVNGVHRGELAAKRRAASYRGILPQLNAFAGIIDLDADAGINAVYLTSGAGISKSSYSKDRLGTFTDERAGMVITRGVDVRLPYFGALLSWDLTKVLFDQEEAPFGRMFGENNRIYLNLKYEVQRLYEERRRLMIRRLTAPPADIRSHLALRLRMEELTAHLNALSGGLYRDELRRLEQEPYLPQEAPP